MKIHDRIEELKREIISLRTQEEEENIKLLVPLIRENCIFKVSWLNHLIRCDRSLDEKFKEQLKEWTVNNYQQYYFGDDIFISWRNGCIDISSGHGFDYSCSDEEYFLPLIKKCKELNFTVDFSSADNDMNEKRNNIQLEIDALERIKQSYE
jgi:hypothetical protein